MFSKEYGYYLNLSKETLIETIERHDNKIEELKKNLNKMEELKDKYYKYNKYHMEEVSRLDKQIGILKGIRK